MNENIYNLINRLDVLSCEMSNKSWFISAFLKYIRTDEIRKYLQYKSSINMLDEKDQIVLSEKLNYLEESGVISDFLYLINNCSEVQDFINSFSVIDKEKQLHKIIPFTKRDNTSMKLAK